MYQEYVTSFFSTDSKRVNLALDLNDYRFSNFFLSEIFSFFHVEDNGILVEYTYSFWRLIFFNTAHSSLITAQMGSVPPLF